MVEIEAKFRISLLLKAREKRIKCEDRISTWISGLSFFKVAHCTLIAFDLKQRKETLKSHMAKFSSFLPSNVIKRGSSKITFIKSTE